MVPTINIKDPWRNGSASDSRSEGCVFDSRRVQFFVYFFNLSFNGSVFIFSCFFQFFVSKLNNGACLGSIFRLSDRFFFSSPLFNFSFKAKQQRVLKLSCVQVQLFLTSLKRNRNSLVNLLLAFVCKIPKFLFYNIKP